MPKIMARTARKLRVRVREESGVSRLEVRKGSEWVIGCIQESKEVQEKRKGQGSKRRESGGRELMIL